MKASANGGVLLLAQAWAALGVGSELLAGLRWQGRAGPLILFALVALPLIGPQSVFAVAALVAGQDILWRVLGWDQDLTQRRLARFVSSSRHDWPEAYTAMLRQVAHQPATGIDPGEPAGVVVDSTTIEKRYGCTLAGIRPVYDAVQRKLVDGYEVVSGCVVNATGSWPIGLLPHQKSEIASERANRKRRRRKAEPGELPSKLDLALRLVGVAIAAGIVLPIVIGDSAFAVMWWLREIEGRGLHWLVSTRHDRRLRIGTAIAPFQVWARQATLICIEPARHGGGVWGALLPEATLLEKGCKRKGLRCRPAYYERRDRSGKVLHQWYLVTSQVEWGLVTIWQHWAWRWKIEVWHRVWKQHLKLAQFHVRSWPGIRTLVACSSLRASLVAFVLVTHPAWCDLSVEGLVDLLHQAASLVELASDAPVQASRPDTLPISALWDRDIAPLPSRWWPIKLKAA